MKYTITLVVWSLALLAFILFAHFSCGIQEYGNEVLNRVEFNFSDKDGGSFNQTFKAFDTNGDWMLDSIQTIALPANSALNCEISIFRDYNRRIRDVTPEIDIDKHSHEFQYTFEGMGLSIDSLSILDFSGQVYGRQSIWTTSANGSGTVRVILLHQNYLADFDLLVPVKIQ